MSHILLIGDDAQCGPVRTQLVQWGLTVGHAAGGGPLPAHVGVDVCDVVLVVGSAVEKVLPDTLPDGGRGAVPAAPRLFLAGNLPAPELERVLWPSLREACLQARELRAGLAPVAGDLAQDVQHQVAHELRSPLTVIKTALEVMEDDLHSWHAEPADVEAQLRMLQIALRNVRRLHRAVEWSQMLLAGPCAESEALAAAGVVPRRPAVDEDPALRACGGGNA